MPPSPATAAIGPMVGTWNPWILLVLQLPARPSNARVKTWRRLRQLGAIPVKNAVYVLPNSAQSLEDFEWLRSEIATVQGQAAIFSAGAVDGFENQEIVEQFRRLRADDYKGFLRDVRRAKKRADRAITRDEHLVRTVRQLRERLTRLTRIDFFSAAGGEDAEREMKELEHSIRRTDELPVTRHPAAIDPEDYRSRTWVTRRRPGVDRFASAWLISRFIDRHAQFAFVDAPDQMPDAVPFDMFGAGFGHEGELCTFEVLQRHFKIADPSVRRIGEIVHDLDLKDQRFRSPEGPGLGVVIEGLRATFDNDSELLQQGIILIDAVYRGLEPAKPRTRRRR